MSATINSLKSALTARIGSTGVWGDSELVSYISAAIEGLYPSFYQRKVATTVAGDGPLQTMPPGARNLHFVGLQRDGSTRVRRLRNWSEGDGEAHMPKTGVSGDTIVWAWTQGWQAPADADEVIGLPLEAIEVVLLRAHIACLESLLTDSVQRERYLSINAREMATDDELLSAIDALHVSVRDRLERVAPLPEVDR